MSWVAPPAAGGNYAFSAQYENSDNATGVSGTTVASVVVPIGALVLVIPFFDNASNPTGTISDGTNTYTQIGTGVHDGQYGIRLFRAYNCTGGTYTVTYNSGTNVNYPGIYVAVFTGIRTASDPYTGTISFGNQATPGTGTDGVTSGNTTPGGQPALVFGFAMDVPSNGAPTAGTGYTSLTSVWDWDGVAALSGRPEHKRVTSTSATAATFTAGFNERHLSMVAAFLEP